MELKRYSDAVQAFRRAAVLDPSNEDLNAKLKEAERAEVKHKPKANADGVSSSCVAGVCLCVWCMHVWCEMCARACVMV